MNWYEKNNKTKLPPVWADRFLEWFCDKNYLEEVMGDMHELYQRNLIEKNKLFSGIIYWWNILKFMRPYLIKNKFRKLFDWGPFMFKSYLKIAVRNLFKNSFFSIINITGLAVGMACVLFIAFFVKDELSYDKFNKNADNIYRISVDARFQGNDFITPETGAPVAQGYKNEFPEVLNYVRLRDDGISFVKYENISFKEPHVFYADSTFFDIFSIKLIRGEAASVLNGPNQLVLSENTAEKYFGKENPIGKILRFDDRADYTVTGVFENFPSNSHFHANLIVSLCTDKQSTSDYWTNANYYSYLLLRDGFSGKSLEDKYDVILKKYIVPEVESFGLSSSEFLARGNKWEFKFQKLTDIHLFSNLPGELEPGGSIEYVYIFSAIGLFILLLASINFINLSTARSAGRAKEVGIKKVIGSVRKDLIFQFLTESVTISLISLVIAVGLVELLLPYFNQLADKNISTSYFDGFIISGSLLGISILTGLLAGSFPAFVFSSFKPVEVLKGDLSGGMKRGWLRSSLVIFQFAISIMLIIGTMVIYSQLNFIQNKNLGFNKEHKLIIDDTYILKDKISGFKERLKEIPEIKNVTVTGFLPIDSYRNTNGMFPDGDKNSPYLLPIQAWRIDTDYFKTMGMEIIEGRNFSPDMPSDSDAVVINESCARHFQWKNPLEHQVSRGAGEQGNDVVNYNVIGVVKDFNFESLRNEIQPVVFFLKKNSGYVTMRISSNNIPKLVSEVEDIWKEYASGSPFSYRFMDESFNKMYKVEERTGKIFGIFALLAVLIGCLGLFALSAYTAERKTKEIGVRRVLGGSIKGMIYLLSREFIKLIMIAYLIAAPIAYFVMNSWLEDYAYRMKLGFDILLLAGIVSLLIAIITVSYHAVKAALINPADSLKYE